MEASAVIGTRHGLGLTRPARADWPDPVLARCARHRTTVEDRGLTFNRWVRASACDARRRAALSTMARRHCHRSASARLREGGGRQSPVLEPFPRRSGIPTPIYAAAAKTSSALIRFFSADRRQALPKRTVRYGPGFRPTDTRGVLRGKWRAGFGRGSFNLGLARRRRWQRTEQPMPGGLLRQGPVLAVAQSAAGCRALTAWRLLFWRDRRGFRGKMHRHIIQTSKRCCRRSPTRVELRAGAARCSGAMAGPIAGLGWAMAALVSECNGGGDQARKRRPRRSRLVKSMHVEASVGST